MEKYVDCHNCKEQYDCERTYLGGCTDGKEWEEKPLLSKNDKEFYFTLMTNCKKVIEKCPNIEERRLACEYCRFEQVRKKAVEEYEQKLEDGELVSKDWHDEQVLHAKNEIEELKKGYIELDLECRDLRTELDKELAEHEEFTKKAKEEIESLKSKSSYKDSWRNKFFKAQEEVERLNLAVEGLTGVNKVLDKENTELIKKVDEFVKIARVSDTKKLVDGIKEQAVKDTAKEILQMIYDDRNGYWDSCDCGKEETHWRDNSIQGTLNEIKERYGVEVE